MLDEDGALGLSEEQLVGVLTSEAGIGVGRVKAVQLWQILANEDPANTIDTTNRRSHSAPPIRSIEALESWGEQRSSDLPANRSETLLPSGPRLSSQPRTMQEGKEGRLCNDNYKNSDGMAAASSLFAMATVRHDTTASDEAATENARQVRPVRAARERARTPSRGGCAAYGARVDVHAFLRLADLLHQSFVVDDDHCSTGQDSSGGDTLGDGEGWGVRVDDGGEGGGIQRYATSNCRADHNEGYGNGSGKGVNASGAGSCGGDCDGRSQPANAVRRGSNGGTSRRSRSGRANRGRRCKKSFRRVVKRARCAAQRVVHVRWFICFAQVGAKVYG